MASIVLSAAGAAVGSAVPVIGPFIGATLGRSLGAQLGGSIDDAIFGANVVKREGPRLEELAVQASTYGNTIPIIYGNMRLAGNIIWSENIKETATTTSQSAGGKGFGGGSRVSTTNYSYSVSLAIAICEGEITNVRRIWADAKLLDLTQGTFRIHYGTEDQLPDPYIEAIEGQGNTPAYRGLAYIVVEDFPLALFGNRIPNFTFEVQRATASDDYNGQSTEAMVRGMTIIPGAGEFVYDTREQFKVQGEFTGFGFAKKEFKRTINHHAADADTNALSSINQLQRTCKNLEWVSVVVTWFGDNLDAGACNIYPAVEYQDDAITEPDAWNVAGFTRQSARLMTYDNNAPRYGGTPDDASLLRYVAELKTRGYKVMLYPMFFMDVENKPWRGRVTGSVADVANFFTKPEGLNRMILHYANLMQNKVDAFVIGSELIGLTRVQDGAGNFPAVDGLMNLAAQVKAIMGAATKVTYAADWSEYHHTDGGWYNLDPLWASPHIDMIGIDAYFPLTEAPQRERGYEVQQVIDGWDSGEGFDYVYDETRTTQQPISPAYAWKNLDWFWNNTHTNPNGQVTLWQPQAKPIWFTEYGFPSVDGATNQPNVFYDPTSSESFFPRGSLGSVDFQAQRQGITGTCARWNDSPMVQNLFLWTWDARPYPYFPDLRNVWADGGVWQTGHWVTGKFGTSSVAEIIRDLCVRSGLNAAHIDVSRVREHVDGFVIAQTSDAKRLLRILLETYLIDAVEVDGVLRFLPQTSARDALRIDAKDCIREQGDMSDMPVKIAHLQESTLPKSVALNVLNKTRNYQSAVERAVRHTSTSDREIIRYVPLVMSANQAFLLAHQQLEHIWQMRTHYDFILGNDNAALNVGDDIILEHENAEYHMRITSLRRSDGRLQVQAKGRAVLESVVPDYNVQENTVIEAVAAQPKSEIIMLDIPALAGDAADEALLRFAVIPDAEGWQGAALFQEVSDNAFQQIGQAFNAASVGMMVNIIPSFEGGNVTDERSEIDVIMRGAGELHSVSDSALLRGANLALIGKECVQFRDAELVSAQRYRLKGLLRGRFGTEHKIATHQAGEHFVLLNQAIGAYALLYDDIDILKHYKAVSIGATLGSAPSTTFTHAAHALRPYAPMHAKTERRGDDIVISWVRRDRIYGAWKNGGDIALSEKNEQYLLEVLNSNNVIRSVNMDVPYYEYTEAQQMDDFGMIVSECNFKISQMSHIVGAGYPAHISYGA